jgi:RNA polymerase sigma factor (sigma-70 family)
MPEPPDNFAALMARAQRGDKGAMAELLQRYAPKVLLVARVLLGPALRPYLDSGDIVQSVHGDMVLAVRKGEFKITSPEQLIAFASKMVQYKVAKHWRHLQKQQRLSGTGEAPTGNLPHLLASLSSPEEDPARAAQFNDQLQHLCDNLGDIDRRILQLRLQGYEDKEIAQDLGFSYNALRTRLSRLRQRLKDIGALSDWL